MHANNIRRLYKLKNELFLYVVLSFVDIYFELVWFGFQVCDDKQLL